MRETVTGVTVPTVTVLRSASRPNLGHPKAVIVTEKGHKVILPYAPESAGLTGFGWDWNQIDRPGNKPLVLRGARRLRIYSYSLVVAEPVGVTSIEPLLVALRYTVDLGERVSWSGMGRSEVGLYRLSLDSINATRREFRTNAITQATANLTFTEAVDIVSRVGPLTGGAIGGALAGALAGAK